MPCQGLGEHAHFANFGMAFLTLFRVATGDNWNGIMKDTLRDDCDDAADCVKNCCVNAVIAPIFFVIFVLMAQFVLVNVVVAVLMKHLEESHKQMEDDMDIETELEREIEREQLFEEEQALCKELEKTQLNTQQKRPLTKVSSLPSNFTYSTPIVEKKFNTSRRQTMQYFNPLLSGANNTQLSILNYNQTPSSTICESNENDLDVDEEKRFNPSRRPSKPINRKNLLNKFRTQSFDVKLLETSDSVELDSQSNIKIGQSNGETAGSSAINNNLMISKKPPVTANKKINYRQSSLDFDNRSSACKYLFDNNSSNLGNKSSFLAVPKLQTTTRNRSGSSKQLFKQAALDEDEQTSESSLLLPGGNASALALPALSTAVPAIPQIQLPSGSGLSLSGSVKSVSDPPISIISSSSSSSTSVAKGEEPTVEMQTLAIDDGNDGNVKKSESCELLRIISERRKL